MGVGELADGFEFGDGVEGAEFCGECDGDDVGLSGMYAVGPGEVGVGLFEIDFGVGAVGWQEFDAGKMFGGGALVGVEMRELVADDGIPGVAKSREAEGVSGGACGNEMDLVG